MIIAAANDPAAALGINIGLRFTDAKARAPHLIFEEIDRAGDAAALRRLAAWMIRIAPIVALDGDDGLMLEVTGCNRLYGGEQALLDQVDEILARNHINCQIAIAGTPGVAHALARMSARSILASGEERQGLANLPICALRLSPDAQLLLRRFGLTRIGQLYAIDRKALARRFQSSAISQMVLLRLDQALGLRAEPLLPLYPPPDFAARLGCLEPLISGDAIKIGLEKLVQQLSIDLKLSGQGACHFTLHAFRADGTKDQAMITTAQPVSDPVHILHLFSERIDCIDPGFGIDLLVLHALRISALDIVAPALSGDLVGRDIDEVSLSVLADRISAKLGQGTVQVSVYRQTNIPERAERKTAFTGKLPALFTPSPVQGPRPVRLFDPPERITVLAEVPDGPPRSFRWRKVQRRVIKSDGPERLSPEWHLTPPSGSSAGDRFSKPVDRKWLTPKLDPRADAEQIVRIRQNLERPQQEENIVIKKRPRTRDYYRVEDSDGRRYWLFRDGLYDEAESGPIAPPEWYVHGLFA